MKITYIIKDISVVGGREKILLNKANYLVKLGYEVSIINYFIEDKERISILNKRIKIYELGFKKKIRKFKIMKVLDLLIFNVIQKIKLKKILIEKINNLNPDITISLIEFGFEEILKIENQKMKKILEIHGCYDYFQNYKKLDYFRKIKGFFEFNFLVNNMKKFDKVIILSNIDKKKWNLQNLEVIPNFYIKNKNVEIVEKFEVKKFISAGRLSYEKGYDILIEIWKEVIKINKNIKIDIYGEGPEEEKIQFLIKKNNLQDNIKINYFSSKLNEKYKEYYGYILPSRFEAFPMVVLESISNAVPVIGFNIDCGIKDMITQDQEGYLVEKYDLKKMAKKITELYNNEDNRKKMAINCLKKSVEFKDEKIMSKWINLFKNLNINL